MSIKKPPHDRKSALDLLQRTLEDERDQHEREILSLQDFKGLSKDNIEFNKDKHKAAIKVLNQLISKAQELKSSSKPAHLFIYQSKFGSPPDGSDPYYFGTDQNVWEGTRHVSLLTHFSGKREGEEWSEFQCRAETDQYFSIFLRI